MTRRAKAQRRLQRAISSVSGQPYTPRLLGGLLELRHRTGFSVLETGAEAVAEVPFWDACFDFLYLDVVFIVYRVLEAQPVTCYANGRASAI